MISTQLAGEGKKRGGFPYTTKPCLIYLQLSVLVLHLDEFDNSFSISIIHFRPVRIFVLGEKKKKKKKDEKHLPLSVADCS